MPSRLRRLASHLSAQVLVAITLAVVLGLVAPELARRARPLGDVFIALVRLVVAPVVFVTITLGLANLRDLRHMGRIGGKAILYFELVTTAALGLGLLVANVTRPGAGIDPTRMPRGDVSRYVQQAASSDFLSHLVPTSLVSAFTSGEVLQVVFVALLTGIALATMGARGERLVGALEQLAQLLFALVGLVMRAAPIGAFGGMAYTIGTFGAGALAPLLRLLLDVYLTMALFVGVVLWGIARWSGFALWPFLRHLREELVITLGTSSSEAVLPRLMTKLEQAGCPRPIVGLVVPTGYSFNLDGTSIYLSMALLFLAQAYGVDLPWPQQLGLLGVLMLTSKGAAGVTGSGFVVLASTVAATRAVPLEGLALLLGVDRFLSEARAIVNLVGNAVATVVIARSEGASEAGRAPFTTSL